MLMLVRLGDIFLRDVNTSLLFWYTLFIYKREEGSEDKKIYLTYLDCVYIFIYLFVSLFDNCNLKNFVVVSVYDLIY